MIQRGSSRPYVVSPVSPLVIFGALSCDFLGGVLRVISWGFLLGVTYEDLVPLWLVTLPQELP
jgi:hypothetical protein